MKEDGSLKTTVYRKKTHTDQYLNFESHHHIEHKKSVVRTLFHRANNIVSEEEDKKQEFQHIKQALKANGYKSWVLKIPEQRKQEDTTSSQTSRPKDKNNISISLPYIKGTSEQIQRILRKHGISSYFKPFNSIRQLLVHPKDKTEIMKQSGVIYHIPCATCQKTYIGETARPLGIRVEEHKKQNSSAILEHQQNTGHKIDWEKVKILEKEPMMIKRKVKEALQIKCHKPALNRDTGLHLPPIYDHLLSRDCPSHVTAEPFSRSDC